MFLAKLAFADALCAGALVCVSIASYGQTVVVVRPGPEGLPVEVNGEPGDAACNIPFAGEASGGTLIVASTLSRNAEFVQMPTLPSESAFSVAQRLAETLNDVPLWDTEPGTTLVISSEGTLRGLPGFCSDYFLAGTESGLGIPKPPVALTYNWSNAPVVSWLNRDAYDTVRVVTRWAGGDKCGEIPLPGSTESFNFFSSSPGYNEVWPAMLPDLDIWVIGVRENRPSNAAGIHVSYNAQDELIGIPFFAGIAPNWEPWSVDPDGGIELAMGQRERLTNTRKNRFYNPVTTPKEKPFYQVIRSVRGGSCAAGIVRTFLGVTPSHTYRLAIRLNTWGVYDESDWSYSFHAVCTGPEDRPLSPRQMAGMDPLPQRAKDFNASRVVEYGPKKRTGSAYKESVKELVVPEGADAITVWLSFRSARPGDQVTMDYIKLEDLGAQ